MTYLNTILGSKRDKKSEEILLKSILKEYEKIDKDTIDYLTMIQTRGSYAIPCRIENTIYKLIAGKRYTDSFYSYSQKETSKYIDNYHIYKNILDKAKIITPTDKTIRKIHVSNNRYLLLEKQSFQEGDSTETELKMATTKDKAIKSFMILLESYFKIDNYNKKLQNEKIVALDLKPSNFMHNGTYIDFTPPKLQDIDLPKNYKPTEYEAMKRIWHYTNEGNLLYLLINATLANPAYFEEYINVLLIPQHNKYHNKFLQFLKSQDLPNHVIHITNIYHRKLPGIDHNNNTANDINMNIIRLLKWKLSL